MFLTGYEFPVPLTSWLPYGGDVKFFINIKTNDSKYIILIGIISWLPSLWK